MLFYNKLFDRIITALMKRMAAQYTFYCHNPAFFNTIFVNSYHRIFRAGWNISAGRRSQGGNKITIKINNIKNYLFHHFLTLLSTLRLFYTNQQKLYLLSGNQPVLLQCVLLAKYNNQL